jgi:hypothetical protein
MEFVMELIEKIDDGNHVVETTYGRMRYIIKDGTKTDLILQQEHTEKWATGEVKRKWVSVPLEFK